MSRESSVRGWGRWGVVFWGALPLCACSLDLGGATGKLSDALEDASDELEDIEICEDMTFGELMNAQSVSDECKEQLQAYLPQAENNFEGRLIVLGQEEHGDGSLSIFVHGVGSDGVPLTVENFADARLEAVVSGDFVVLGETDWSLVDKAEMDGDLLSIGFVNDYSGSMSADDLRLNAEIETELVSVLPEIFEGEVTLFATDVEQRLPFTDDRNALLDALEYQDDFERGATALYDGFGRGVESLANRERPLRLGVLATDGQENASMAFSREEVVEIVAEQRLCVLVLGSLFADPNELRELAGDCGVYFYTPAYGDLKAAVGGYIESISHMSEFSISSEARGEGELRLSVGGLSVVVDG